MKKRVFWAVITAGVMLSGCATNYSWRYYTLSEPLPHTHPLKRVCEADTVGMAKDIGAMKYNYSAKFMEISQERGVQAAMNSYDLRNVIAPPAISNECFKAREQRKLDPAVRMDCALFRMTTSRNDGVLSSLKSYHNIPSLVKELADVTANSIARDVFRNPKAYVPIQSCPEIDSLTDQFRLASALYSCNNKLAKAALAETQRIDEKIEAATGVIEFHAVKLARLAPSGVAHILLGNVYGISKIEPCVAKDWAGNPDAFVSAAIDAAKAIVFQPVWSPELVRDVEIGMFVRRIHDVAKAIDPATNKPWLTREQRQRLSEGLLEAFESKDFQLMKDRKHETLLAKIDNLPYVITVGNFLYPSDMSKPHSAEELYAGYLLQFDTNRMKMKDALIEIARAVASDVQLQDPIEAAEAYARLNGKSGSGEVSFESLFK